MKDKTVLLVDDDEDVLYLLSDALKEKAFHVITATSASQAFERLKKESVDVVALDLKMPQIDGIAALKVIKTHHPHVPVIMLSGEGTIEEAVHTLKLGAYDFLEKTVSTNRIIVTLENVLRRSELEQENRRLRQSVQDKYRMIGRSEAINEVRRMVKKIAPTDSSVLITGESGTGKELVARHLHFNSQRAGKSFVSRNITELSEGVIEPELFGHEKGAFTGAEKSKPGLFEQAHTGTLFLDEVAEMASHLQPKLLRAIETGEIQRVGGTSPNKVNVRIITATNKDLTQAIKKGDFRQDLYFRLKGLKINVPPLRERKEDIPDLVDHFMDKIRKRKKIPPVSFHPHAMELLISYSWPGNIRELMNLLDTALTLSDSAEILPGDIESHFETFDNGTRIQAAPEPGETLVQTVKRVEREVITTALNALNWNYERVIKTLGISRANLFYKMDALGIQGKRKRFTHKQ